MENDVGNDVVEHHPSRRSLVLTGLVAAIILSTLAVSGAIPRLRAAAEVASDRERAANEPAHVEVTRPHRQATAGKVVLPATVQALQEAVINARASGYIHAFNVDIGDAVKVGQVMATLDTPDIDEELRAAEAAAAQASANIEQAKTELALASTESTRYQRLAGSGVVSQQDMEEHQANFDARGAGLRATNAALHTAEANVQRLRDLKQFATIVAPFDGVVTVRNIEIGQLVTAGTGQAMFRVANTSTVRLFVNVPQVHAPAVKAGDSATISLREFPTRTFDGKVTRTAHALDPATRTLTTQIDIPNRDGALLPGMYAQVSLAAERIDSPLMIPPSALVADASGTRVAVVEHGAIRWRRVKVDSNLGDELAILSGLSDGEQIVVAPSERLSDGLLVQAEETPPAAARVTATGKLGKP
jgi:membrane fusion protein, multidrug efflux system